jgi:hypothetical protein
MIKHNSTASALLVFATCLLYVVTIRTNAVNGVTSYLREGPSSSRFELEPSDNHDESSEFMDDESIILESGDFVDDPSPYESDENNHRSLSTIRSPRTVLVLRIEAEGIGSPTVSKDELYKRIFSDVDSLTRQMERCSAGDVQLVPTKYGVIDIFVAGTNHNTPRNELVSLAKSKALELVDENYNDIRVAAHHVIIVSPDRFDGFVAAAEVAFQGQNAIAVYSDMHAAHLSVLMHETAHNLGLNHASWQGKEYGDKTGNMGASSAIIGGPLYCYNAANHWQLNWYSDSRFSFSIEASRQPITIVVVAFVDYFKVRYIQGKYVLVKVGNFYMQYNRAKDYNVGTKAMPNQLVLIQSDESRTELIAGIDSDNPIYSDNSVFLEVCKVELVGEVDQMVVSIGRSNTAC